MKKQILFGLLMAFSIFAIGQQVTTTTVESTGKQFVMITTYESGSGAVTITRSAPMDTASVRSLILEQSKSVARQMAEMQLRISALQKEKDKADALFAQVGGGTLEDVISGPLEFSVIGEYAFQLGGKADKLTIEKKGNDKRLAARLDSGGKGTVKIEAESVAVILSVFKDAKKNPIDVKFSRQPGSGVWIAEIDGILVKFMKAAAVIGVPKK